MALEGGMGWERNALKVIGDQAEEPAGSSDHL